MAGRVALSGRGVAPVGVTPAPPPSGDGRGHDADAPSGIPARGWREVLRRTLGRASEERLLTEAAGVAFYAVFALLAALAGLVSSWALLGDPAVLERRVNDAAGTLPAGLPEIIGQLLAAGADRGPAPPGLVALGGLAAALWGATAAAQALLGALNLAYGEHECRGALRLAVLSLAIALGGALFALLGLGAFLALPEVVGRGGSAGALLGLLRWPALLAAAAAGLAALYRFGPCRAEPRWRWVGWGGVFAAVAWVLGSAAFSWYARRLGGYGAVYGPLGAVVAFMTWAWLSAAAVLTGALLNAEAERQTVRDTTVGPRARGWPTLQG